MGNSFVTMLLGLMLLGTAAAPRAWTAEPLAFAIPIAAPGNAENGLWSRLLAPAETGRGLQALAVAALLAIAVDRLRAGDGTRRRRRS